MKNRILFQHYYLPHESESEVAVFVEYYNHEHVHESRGNVTPADVFFGKQAEILSEREMIKRKTYASGGNGTNGRSQPLDSEG